MAVPEIFDRTLRRIRRDRAARHWDEHAFLQQRMAGELLQRLDTVQREFSRVLILGYVSDAFTSRLRDKRLDVVTADASQRLAARAGGVQCDEDRLPFRDASFDLVLAAGTLDTVNDLPGALTLIRRCLKPDGLFLAGFLGAGSLPVLRAAMMQADLASNRAAPRIHPQIDIRAAGDLLGRAGFALQVADGESVEVRYSGFAQLIADLRGSANGSLLRGPALSQTAYAAAHAAFEAQAIGGRIAEHFEIVYMTGWSPAPDQPKPAARGSGSASLADALRRKG